MNSLRQSILYTALRAQGMDFRRHLAEAQDFQHLDFIAMMEEQSRRFRRVVQRAACSNRVYQEILRERAGVTTADLSSVDLRHLPPVNKDELARIAACVRAANSWSRPIVKRTSGSSGRPLSLLKQRSGLSRELAATWRSYGWYGLQPGDRNVQVWGRPLSRKKRFVNAVKGFALNSVRISAFDVTERTLTERVARIVTARPRFIYGYASALRDLAEFMSNSGQCAPEHLRAVISTAEPLESSTRDRIEAAFDAPCRDEYGCSEAGTIAHECSHGQFHVMADNLICEVLKDDGTVASDGLGELLLTDLVNELTPVIRYRLGDYCSLEPGSSCGCGLNLPLLKSIQGRVEDTVILADGTRHHPAKICYLVDEADKRLGIVRQYQVIQRSFNELEIRLVGGTSSEVAAFSVEAEKLFRRELCADLILTVTPAMNIPRERSGKFQLVKRQTDGSGATPHPGGR